MFEAGARPGAPGAAVLGSGRRGRSPLGFCRQPWRTCIERGSREAEDFLPLRPLSFFLLHQQSSTHHRTRPSANITRPPPTPAIPSAHIHSQHTPAPAISGSFATASATPLEPLKESYTHQPASGRRAGFMYSSHANALAVDPAHVEQSFRILRKPRSSPHRNNG